MNKYYFTAMDNVLHCFNGLFWNTTSLLEVPADSKEEAINILDSANLAEDWVEVFTEDSVNEAGPDIDVMFPGGIVPFVYG
jgi:hypothetical protein